MKVKVYNQTGKEVGSVDLNEAVFGLDANKGLIHRALMYQLSNARQVSAHTKGRGEVRGSTRKLFRQKGTGNARMGSNRSPIRVGGGVSFGPRNTVNFTIGMNKKERRLALCQLLSTKVNENAFIVVDKIDLKEMKTKLMNEIINALPIEKKALLVHKKEDVVLAKSSRNIPHVKPLLVEYLNIHDLLKFETLVVSQDMLEQLNALR